MKLHDLSVGNNVEYLGFICDVNMIDYSDDKVDLYNGNHFTGIDIDEVEPIHLTVELLLRMGFVMPFNKEYFTHKSSVNRPFAHLRIAQVEGIDGWHVSVGDDEQGCIFKRIYHVHQWQNIYYIFTDELITITNL